MFTVIAAAISAGRALYQHYSGKPIPPSVDAMITSGSNLYKAIQEGYLRVIDDDGTLLSPAQFDAKFAAWDVAQQKAGEHAAARIDARHED